MIQLAKQPQSLPVLWCARCGKQIAMVTPQQAAVMTGMTVRAINGWVESDRVHFVETEDGLLLLCVSSLRYGLLSGPEDVP